MVLSKFGDYEIMKALDKTANCSFSFVLERQLNIFFCPVFGLQYISLPCVRASVKQIFPRVDG